MLLACVCKSQSPKWWQSVPLRPAFPHTPKQQSNNTGTVTSCIKGHEGAHRQLAVFCVDITHLSKILKACAYEGNLVILSNLNLLLHRAQQLGSELIDVQNVAEDHVKVLGRRYAMSVKMA